MSRLSQSERLTVPGGISFPRFHLKIRVKQPHPENCQGNPDPGEYRETERRGETDQVRIETAQYIERDMERDRIFDAPSTMADPSEK